MNWFYVDAGQQAGPVTDEQLDELVRNGKVRGDTLVWREGLANWQPYSQGRPEGVQPPAPAPTAAPPPPALGGAIPPPGGPAPVPGTYQPMPGTAYGLAYGGFWIRVVAKIIDTLILGVVVGIPVGFFIVPSLLSGSPAQMESWITFFSAAPWQLLDAALSVLYNGLFVGKFGATPGKMALGLKVVLPDGSPIGYGRAFGRAAASILSKLICLIGYIIAAFDVQKRALHDHIAGTRVIRTRL
jgi:uncharacterized RDD family membrane protein YckC